MSSEGNRDLHASVFFLLASLLSFPLIFNFIEGAQMAEVSPLFWPIIAASLMLLFSLISLCKEIKGGARIEGKGLLLSLVAPKKQYVFLILALVYIQSMEYFGFLLSSMLSLPVFLFYFGSKKKGLDLVISVVFLGVVFYCFSEFFKISFPKWNL